MSACIAPHGSLFKHPAVLGALVCVGLAVACSGQRRDASEHVARMSAALSPDVWAQTQVVEASDNNFGLDFGTAIAMSGDTALAGAPNHTGGGAVYVLVRSGTSWAEQQVLTLADGQLNDELGTAVALDGDTAIATRIRNTAAGAVFVRSGTTWTLQQKLLPGDGAPNATFGVSAALSGDTAIVGSSEIGAGAAYAFVRSGSTWAEQQKLVPADSSPFVHFGVALAVSGDTALAGAFYSDTTPGAVYFFTRSGSVWTQQQKLSASDAAADDGFGDRVALDGDTAVVGAKSGAYVLVRTAGVWSEQQKLPVAANQPPPPRGDPVALSGDTALIGAIDDDYGAAYVFGRSGTTWTDQQRLVAADREHFKGFGSPVALAPDLALVGIWLDGGDLLAFDRGPANGTACSTDADCASAHCADGVCCDTACSGACDACSVAAGAAVDGTCAVVAKGSPGSPSCAPLGCNGSLAHCACLADSDCAAGQTCVVATGTCVAAGAPGTSCGDGGACSSGNCVDGICCDTPCAGGCEVCSLARGAPDEGTCTPVHAGGINCGFGFVCDGASGNCPTSCKGDTDCAVNFHCSLQQTCVPTGSGCSADLSESLGSAVSTKCTPYLCDPATGTCRLRCRDGADCDPLAECTPSHACAFPGSDGGVRGAGIDIGASGGSCGCRAAGRHQQSGVPLLLLGLLALGVRRRLDPSRGAA